MGETNEPTHADAMFADPIDDVLRRTAARTPELGAGPHAALTAASAAALATMVARFSGLDDRIPPLEAAGARLRELADADGPAFAPLLEAWALPRDAPRRDERIAEAARIACGVPLEVCRLAAQIARTATELGEVGKRDLRGDAAASVHLADAAARCAAVLVRLNAGRDRAPDLVAEARDLSEQTDALAERVRPGAW